MSPYCSVRFGWMGLDSNKNLDLGVSLAPSFPSESVRAHRFGHPMITSHLSLGTISMSPAPRLAEGSLVLGRFNLQDKMRCPRGIFGRPVQPHRGPTRDTHACTFRGYVTTTIFDQTRQLRFEGGGGGDLVQPRGLSNLLCTTRTPYQHNQF